MSSSSKSRPPAAAQDFSTRAVRSGVQTSNFQEHSEPLFLTSSFIFNTAEEAAQVFAGEREGYVYSRYTNPTVSVFEQRLATLEGADFCLATASGMAALWALCMCVLKPGDRVVASRYLFGTSVALLAKYLPRMGVQCDFVDLDDLQAWEKALDGGAALAFLETPANPVLQIADVPAIARLCERGGTQLAVDNTLPTAVQMRPLELGADWSVLSATKWLDGQGRCVGGALLGSSDKEEAAREHMRIIGPTLGAFEAWIFLKGLETLELRVQKASETALLIATQLASRPELEQVYYPGLPDHPGHALAASQMDGFGAVISFRLSGGREGAWRFMDATRMLSITPNLGDTRSTLVHPDTTTHRLVSPEEKERAGIAPGLVRLVVGLESERDIMADLERGFAA